MKDQILSLDPESYSDSDQTFFVRICPLDPLIGYDFPFDNQIPNRRFSAKYYKRK